MSDRTCTTRIYKGVVVCNGYHKDKSYPDFLGRLSGETLHSKDYEGPGQIEMGQPGSRRKLARDPQRRRGRLLSSDGS